MARDHEALRARFEETTALLTLLGIDPWLRDAIERAKASGWRVECTPTAIVFARPEGSEHTVTVHIPLPDDPAAVARIKAELQSRVFWFERCAS